MLVQTEQDSLHEDEYSNTIYPTDTLLNIGINGTQTLAPDIAYFYLQNTLGLSEETMWKITLEAGSVLGMTPRNLERKVSLLRRTMNLSDEDVRIILGKQPALLHYSADRNLAPTILFLVRALDLGKSELRKMVMDCPSILGYALGNLKRKIAFFVALGYADVDSIRELLVATPKLLLSSVDTGLIPRMKFLLNEINFSLEELRLVYKKNPRLLLYSVDDNLREKIVFFFILGMRMEPEHVRKILLAYPQIMDYNLVNHMKPIADFFTTELKFSDAEFGSIILKFPRIFSYSLFKIKHVTGFLRYELELDPRQTKRIIFQAPQILGLADDNVKEKLQFLREYLDLTPWELGLVFSGMPTLICLSVDNNLLPKLEYLEDAFRDQDHPTNQLLKEAILKQPTLLGYSLRRVQTRMERLVDADIFPGKITVGISMSEDKFELWLSSSKSKKLTRSIVAKRNSTASGVLLSDLKFSEEELDMICSELPDMSHWTVPSLKSWTTYLKEELHVPDAELKNILLSHPVLLDGSSRRKVRHRMKKMQSISLSIVEHLDAIYWSDEEFCEWIILRQKESRSKIAYLQKMLGLNVSESRALLAAMPTLESAHANKIFKDKLDYLVQQLWNSTEDAKMALLGQPSLLDLSLEQVIEPRMERIQQAGLSDPQTISALITMSDDAFLRNDVSLNYMRRQFSEMIGMLETTLKFDQEETVSLLLAFGNNLAAPVDVAGAVNYLLSLADSDVDRVKAAVLKQPDLLLLSPYELENRIVERISPLQTEADDTFTIVTMTDTDYQTRLSLNTLQNMLHFTENEIYSIMAGRRGMAWQNDTLTLATKIDYLLSQGTKDDVKNAILTQLKLLSYSLEELKSMSNALAAKRSKYTVLRFKEETRAILRDALGLAAEDVNSVLSRSRYLLVRDPEEFLVPKLDYLVSLFDGECSKNHVATFVLANPGLLDHSLRDWIMPRVKLLMDSGLDLTQINGIISPSPHEMSQRKKLQTHLNLTDTELESLIPMKFWLRQPRLRQNAEPNIQYLASHLTTDDLKLILLEEPKLLTLSLSKKIQPRMEMLLGSGCPSTDMSKIVVLSQSKAEDYCCLCGILGFSSNQMNRLLTSIGTRQSSESLKEKVDYLLQHAFGGSKKTMKAAILQNPALIKQSLKNTKPRMDTLQYLHSIGLEYHPSDIASFFTQSYSSFTKELAPKVQNWYPNELDKGEVTGNDIITSEKDVILASLKDLSPSLAMAYSDESNREGARVVHWR